MKLGQPENQYAIRNAKRMSSDGQFCGESTQGQFPYSAESISAEARRMVHIQLLPAGDVPRNFLALANNFICCAFNVFIIHRAHLYRGEMQASAEEGGFPR